MAIDRTGASADTPAGPKRSGGWPATAFLPREEYRRRSPQAGEEGRRPPLRSRRPRRSRPPSRLAHQRTHPKTAGPNQVERRRRQHPTAPTRSADGSPRHQRRRGPTPVRHHRRRTDHDRPSRPRPSPGAGPSYAPTWISPDRPSKGSALGAKQGSRLEAI